MDVAKVLSPQAAKKINGKFLYDTIWSSLQCFLYSFDLNLFQHTYPPTQTNEEFFFQSLYAVTEQNFCLSHCGCTRLSENRVSKQKRPATMQRSLCCFCQWKSSTFRTKKCNWPGQNAIFFKLISIIWVHYMWDYDLTRKYRKSLSWIVPTLHVHWK